MVKTMQIKTCRKKRHVRIDSMKEMPNLICGKGAVGGNYNSTRDNLAYCVSNSLCIERLKAIVLNKKAYMGGNFQ